LSDHCSVTLVDTDLEALHFASQAIREVKVDAESRIQSWYLNKSVQKLILDPHVLDSFKNQDLIYALGLFDYLSPRSAVRVVQNLYESLSEGGQLIIGNFGTCNDSSFYMEYGLEWYLLYRSSKEMVRLAEGLPLSSKVRVDMDDSGVQLYLVIDKEKRPHYQRIEYRASPVLYGQI
jgi:chemotaxis methyl-accepting protein methylase